MTWAKKRRLASGAAEAEAGSESEESQGPREPQPREGAGGNDDAGYVVAGGGHPLGVKPWGTLLFNQGGEGGDGPTLTYAEAVKKRQEGKKERRTKDRGEDTQSRRVMRRHLPQSFPLLLSARRLTRALFVCR